MANVTKSCFLTKKVHIGIIESNIEQRYMKTSSSAG